MIRKRVLRTGDGSHRYSQTKTAAENLLTYVHSPDRLDEKNVWGWDDLDMKKIDIEDAKIYFKAKTT